MRYFEAFLDRVAPCQFVNDMYMHDPSRTHRFIHSFMRTQLHDLFEWVARSINETSTNSKGDSIQRQTRDWERLLLRVDKVHLRSDQNSLLLVYRLMRLLIANQNLSSANGLLEPRREYAPVCAAGCCEVHINTNRFKLIWRSVLRIYPMQGYMINLRIILIARSHKQGPVDIVEAGLSLQFCTFQPYICLLTQWMWDDRWGQAGRVARTVHTTPRRVLFFF